MRSRLVQPFIIFSGLLFNGMAYAHSGHGAGYLAGLAHPLLGLDHVLAMLAVGVWAAQLGGRATWAAPISFIVVMVFAAKVAVSGIALPAVESGIATSVLLLGLLVTFSIKASPVFAAITVGVFAFFHGFAHGLEVLAGESSWSFSIGFVVSTIGLHMAGMLIGFRLRERPLCLRAMGCFVFASGAFMITAA